MSLITSRKKFSRFWYFLAALTAANIAVYVGLAEARPHDFAQFYTFDVGQGDAHYLRTIAGNDILIDGGPGDAVVSKLGRVMPLFDREIEVVFLTHPHADHASGLLEVLRRYKVKRFVIAEVGYDSATYQTLLARLQEENVEIVRPKLGQRYFLDSSTVLDVLYPIAGKFDKAPKDVNQVSTVARISFGQSHILLTGDADKEIEEMLVAAQVPLDAAILKVGHQGSSTSTGKGFLAAVEPKYGVISVGKNNYGHPHQETLDALSQAGAEILRTDERGDIGFRIYPDRIVLSR
ncbi:MAG: ComEC/Rec2 family competence protein [bacterium]|nr:ComEC/Rec2 family competence protein [bacterium]